MQGLEAGKPQDDISGVAAVTPNLAPSVAATSIASSAVMQQRADQIVQRELLLSERKRAEQLSDECKRLRAQLLASNEKRERPNEALAPADLPNEPMQNPRKRHSPPASVGVGPITDYFQRSVQKKLDFVPETRETAAPKIASASPKMSVPSRSPQNLAHLGVFPLAYRGLDSLLCADFDSTNKITVGEGNLTYSVAADLLREEIKEIPTWPAQLKRLRHPMVVSAIALVYPSEIQTLLKRSFMKSTDKITAYWSDVLTKFQESWSATP